MRTADELTLLAVAGITALGDMCWHGIGVNADFSALLVTDQNLTVFTGVWFFVLGFAFAECPAFVLKFTDG